MEWDVYEWLDVKKQPKNRRLKKLIKQSEHKNSDVRISATEALGQIGARKAVKKCQLRH